MPIKVIANKELQSECFFRIETKYLYISKILIMFELIYINIYIHTKVSVKIYMMMLYMLLLTFLISGIQAQ